MRPFSLKLSAGRLTNSGLMPLARFRDARRHAARAACTRGLAIETEHVRWAHEALLPICFVRAVIESSEFRFLGADNQVVTPAAASARAGMPIEMPLWNVRTKTYVPLRQALEHLWDVALDIGQIGESAPEISSESCCYLLHNANGVSVPVTLAAKFRAKITYHYNVISLSAFRGFFDESSREILPAKYETDVLEVDTILETWPSTSSKDDVPFVPVDHLLMLGFVHRKSKTPKRFTLGRTFGPAPEGTIPV